MRRKRKYFVELTVIGIIFLLLAIMFLINEIVTEVGFNELKLRLRSLNVKESKNDYLPLVSKFRLQMELYENEINEKDFILDEAAITALSGFGGFDIKSEPQKYRKILPSAVSVINHFRSLINRPLLLSGNNVPGGNYLNVAYYCERNKLYKEALKQYSQALELMDKNDERIPVVQLHKIYCSSLIGDFVTGSEICKTIILEDRNSNVTQAAIILLDYLNNIRNEILTVLNSDDEDIEIGIKLFQLMAFDEALDKLDSITPRDTDEFLEIQYYKARILEEQGEIDSSVTIYQDIITNNPQSDLARQSNFRILSLSKSLANQDLKALSDKNNQIIRDEEYEGAVQYLSKIGNTQTNQNLDEFLGKSSINSAEIDEIRSNIELKKSDSDQKLQIILDSFLENDGTSRVSSNDFFYQTVQQIKIMENKLDRKNSELNSERANIEEKEKEILELELSFQYLKQSKENLEDNLNELEEELLKLRTNVSNNKAESPEAAAASDIVSKEVVTNRNQEGKIITQYNYLIDSNGNRTVESYSIYYYDKENVLYQISEYDSDNNLSFYYTVDYDDSENKINIKKYDKFHNPVIVN